jgi:hypothetical protein
MPCLPKDSHATATPDIIVNSELFHRSDQVYARLLGKAKEAVRPFTEKYTVLAITTT